MSDIAKNKAAALVLDKLAQHKAAVFKPIGQGRGIDLAVRGQDGQYVELLCLASERESPRYFLAPRFRRRPNLIMACVVTGSSGPTEAWLVPSGVFERFGTGKPNGEATLDLDADEGGLLHERLSVYRERWQLITEFAQYRSTLEDPVALRIRLAMG